MSGRIGTIQSYVQIATQKWQRRNLDVTTYRNGDVIPYVKDNTQWANLTTGAWCYYNNDPALGAIYGKLYNWYAVNDPRGLAPEGWHVPTNAEWVTLATTLGGSSVAGGKLKETGTTHWSNPNTGATNSSGFKALPGGFRDNINGQFLYINLIGQWWSADQFNTTDGNSCFMEYDSVNLNISQDKKDNGNSVRCIKD